MFQSNFKMDSHVNYLLSQCAQRMYILKLLRHQGMSSDQIISVAYALISGVLLKMEVGIRKGRGEGPEGTLLIYDH